jgi:hypothetical protein
LSLLSAIVRRQAFVEMIDEEYRNHMLLDNLPIAMSVFHESGAVPDLTFFPLPPPSHPPTHLPKG